MSIIIRILSFIFSSLPPEVSLFFARILGRIYFLVDSKHRKIAYNNLRLSLAASYSSRDLRKILKNYYLNLAQNFVEILYSRKIDSAYIEKYIKIDGADNFVHTATNNKSLILISAHFGNWEIPNIICRYLYKEKPYLVLVNDKIRKSALGRLLDRFRLVHGYEIVSTDGPGLREVMASLEKGALLGLVIDQGMGKSSVFVNFFNHRVPAPTGAMKLAMKFNTPLVLSFIRRIKGPYQELKVFPEQELLGGGSDDEVIAKNSQVFNKKIEEAISLYPENYLWQFKRFKNRLDRKIIILNDCKTGHLRQSEAVAETLRKTLEKKGLIVESQIIDIKFKSEFKRASLAVIIKLFGPAFAFNYLKTALDNDCFESVLRVCPDFVISAGSSTAGLNLIISQENQSRPIVIMKPAFFSTRKFKLVISPWHDNLGLDANVLKVEAAPNLIDEDYLAKNSLLLKKRFAISDDPAKLRIGLLLGGDTRDFILTKDAVGVISDQLLSLASVLGAEIFVTSSRRTSKEVEALLKNKFSSSKFCKLLIIASDNNVPEAVGGILGICQVIVTSADSISMVSEAASSGKYTLVFKPDAKDKLSNKHARFLEHLNKEGFIYIVDSDIEQVLRKIWAKKPSLKKLDDAKLIKEAFEKII